MSGQSALILAPEPWSFDGSLGDQAMLSAIRERLSNQELYTLAFTEYACERAERLGYLPIQVSFPAFNIDALLEQTDPSLIFAVGADIIDGSYGAPYASWMLEFLQRGASRGIACTLGGSSFSTSPDQLVVETLRALDPAVRLCMRDTRSLTRMRDATGIAATLVADVALLMRSKPAGPIYEDFVSWSQAVKPSILVGLNLHSALFASPESAVAFAQALSPMLDRLSADQNIAWVLIPHDTRHTSGDHLLLSLLRKELAGDVWLCDQVADCAIVKAIAALCDGVVGGRMHLAIAALGQGVPVLCLTYKEKFEGLLEHFDLPSDTWLEVTNVSPDTLVGRMEEFLQHLTSHRTRIAAKLPMVLALAEKNFEAPMSDVDT